MRIIWNSKRHKLVPFVDIWQNLSFVSLFHFLSAVLFIKTFFKTMEREWHGIDRLRLDKFYLVRIYYIIHSTYNGKLYKMDTSLWLGS